MKSSSGDLVFRADGRIEWLCIHNIGHTAWYPERSDSVHGCDGCCSLEDFKQTVELLEKKYGKLGEVKLKRKEFIATTGIDGKVIAKEFGENK
jgi:hypothetical protein